MSPRAASRLETLGFARVYDYFAGKADWLAAGGSREGKRASELRAGEVARRDDVVCSLNDRLGAVAERVRAAGKDSCLVATDERVVVGRLRQRALEGDPDTIVEAVMESGPTTIRPDRTLASVVERLRPRAVDRSLVTTSDGRLVGTLYLEDAERRLEEDAERRAEEDEASCECDS